MNSKWTNRDEDDKNMPRRSSRKHSYHLLVLAVCLTSSLCGSTWMLSSFQHTSTLPSSVSTANSEYSKPILNNDFNSERDANYVSAAALSCQEYTPECDSLERIQQQWNYRGNDYNQTICCREHAYLRQGVLQVWQALEAFNVTAWMDGGSAIGIARHNGTQVPWETDADISFWVEIAYNPSQQLNISQQLVQLFRKRMAKQWSGRIVHFLNQLPTNHPPSILLHPTEPQQQLSWNARIISFSHNCVHFQLYQTLLLLPREDNPIIVARIGLFGVVRKNTTQGDAYQYLKCFRNRKYKDQHAYDSFPPSSCLFYGTPIWCPRDLISYIVHYYGENVLHQGVSHEGFYGKHYQPGKGNGV